jgi:conjugative relaxase-like TrwC/TraI family protein
MLSIGLVSAGQEQYYVELSREDYYTESGEPEGRWFGTGAARLGLDGTVGKDELSKLIQGFAPSGEKLVRNAGSETRRAGLDLTFNAPKSVSVLWSQAQGNETRKAIQEAHAAAVEAALRYIEQDAAFVRYGLDGANRKSAGLIVATFEHSSARLASPDQLAPDPHLHTHALVINAGVAEDGFTATLDSRELYRHKMAAGVLYRAELFRQLEQRLGISAERRGRFCELKGIPEELLEEFSKRRRAIEEYLEERGNFGAAHSDDAALKTRTVKPKVDRESFFAEWQRIGAKFGFEVDDEFLRRGLAEAPERDVDQVVREATSRAIRKVTEQSSHFARRELIRALADELEDKGVGADVVLDAADRALESPEIRSVGEAVGELRFTTEEMLQLERTMLREAAGLARRSEAVSSTTLVQVLRSRPTITDEQLEALHHMTERKSLAMVRGLAGTGKTFIMEAAREAWELEGRTVLGATLAATAAKRLQEDSGIKSETLHRLLWRLENGKLELDRNSVVVIDEAAMVGTRQLAALIRAVSEAHAKLVLVGDDRQLQAIDAGAPFASLAKRFGAAELNDIRRQKREWARDAVVEFSRGDAKKAIRRFQERGLVRVAATRRDAIQQLVDDFEVAAQESGLKETVALAGTRAEARKLNREIQLRRKARGELGDRVVAGEESFYVGDRILFRKNSKRLGILNGDRGEVVAVTENVMTVRLDSGDRVSVDVRDHELVMPHLGYAATTHSMQGATVDRCFVLCGGSMQDREATYVQASRAREETRLYVDRVSAGEEFGDMIRAMERSRAKDLAVDIEDLLSGQEGDGQELRVA